MTTFALNPSIIAGRRDRVDVLGTLAAGWAAMRRHRRARHEAVALSRMSPRLLLDMGIDPERVYEALDGTGDAVGPAHLSALLPRFAKV